MARKRNNTIYAHEKMYEIHSPMDQEMIFKKHGNDILDINVEKASFDNRLKSA